MCASSHYQIRQRTALAEVHHANERELKALDEFIAYKGRCVERVYNVERNLQAIEETEWLKEYLE